MARQNPTVALLQPGFGTPTPYDESNFMMQDSTPTLSPRAHRLRDAGFKLTTARLTVLAAIESGDGHVTSGELLERVNALDPGIGRASVFRTLDLFTRLSLIRPTYITSSASPTYVLMPDGHHHHIICMNCHRVIEFDECGLAALTRDLEQRYQVQISGHLLELYGMCETCLQATATADEDS
ncbi:MAG: Fur family transcriptional regulator [Chloroflexota bacterium]|nr:Fur family transcriptional regulator [Chloroflexota bacterium]